MSAARVDVVVPVYRGVEMTRACLASVLAHSGPRLGRLLVVNDQSPEPGMRPMLEALRLEAPAVRVLENEQNLGFIGACNRGLALREGHVVVLNSDTRVTAGWLDELVAALEGDPRVAAASPLSNNATLCSIPTWSEGVEPGVVEGRALGTDAVERFTEMPTLVGFCMLLRCEAVDALGGFDPAYGRGYNEENDWCQRARAAGYRVVRANRALVLHLGEASFVGARAQLDRHNARRLVARYPNYVEENAAFASTLGAHAAALAHRVANGPVRVRLVVGEHGHPDWAALVAALREELVASAGVTLADGDGPADVLLVAGSPRLEALPGVLGSTAHLVYAPFDLVELEGRPTGPRWADVEARRAVAFALWSSGAVVLQSDADVAAAAALLGPAPAALWVRRWPLARPGAPTTGGGALLLSSARVTAAELGFILDAWARVRPAGRSLRLAVPAASVPAGWRPQLGALGITLEAPRPLDALVAGVDGLLVPHAESAEGPEALTARVAGLPVVQVTGDPAVALARLLSLGAAAPIPAPAPQPWGELLRGLCASGAGTFSARARLQELLRVSSRRGSSS